MKARKIVKIFAVCAFICAGQWACHEEWAMDVVHYMGEEEYARIKNILGEDASISDVAEYYVEHKNK